ncbi:sigma-E factor negative regulatory protein RseB [Oxalobacteraceae bacterium GrIS 2.11]
MRIAFFCFLLSFVAPVLADESSEAQALIQKIQVASKSLNYSGTFVFQQDNQLVASQIIHRYRPGDEREKIEKLDGHRREYIRHNEEIVSYQPDMKTLRTERRQAQDMFPAVLAFNNANLGEHYAFRLSGFARVAGVDCRMVIIEPRDALRYGYRLCAAISNNLMLLAQTTTPNNQVLEQIAFTSLTFGEVDENSLRPSYVNVSDWKSVRNAVAVSTESGWTVRAMPEGFKKIREVRRLISIQFSSNLGGPSNIKPTDLHEVLQLVFSDGLATISIFVEPLTTERSPGLVQKGATTISGFQLGKFWITVVGEVPVAAIKLLSDSIEYKPK